MHYRICISCYKVTVHDRERRLDFSFCLKTAHTDAYTWLRTTCHHSTRFCIAVRYCMLGEQNKWGIGLTPEKATYDPDRSYFSWCQARGGHVALFSFLEPSINTSQFPGVQIQLWNISNVLISKCWVLQSCVQAEKGPFISILSWYDGKEQLRRCTLLLPRLVFFLCPCVCSSSKEELEYSLPWSPASSASLQHYPGRLVNTGNTNPLNTSLLCLEDCHDNTQWTPREIWCLLGGSILRYAQALPSWPRACS